MSRVAQPVLFQLIITGNVYQYSYRCSAGSLSFQDGGWCSLDLTPGRYDITLIATIEDTSSIEITASLEGTLIGSCTVTGPGTNLTNTGDVDVPGTGQGH